MNARERKTIIAGKSDREIKLARRIPYTLRPGGVGSDDLPAMGSVSIKERYKRISVGN
jgi:hypothetical protein